MSEHERDYWIYKGSRDSTYARDIHQEQRALLITEQEFQLFAMLKPALAIDGNQYEVLYGSDPVEGVVGYGDTPYLAILDWNKSWHKKVREGDSDE